MINDQAICRWCARVALLAVCQVILLLSVSDSRGVSIWPTSAVPAVASAPDAVGVEVGVKFESAADGYVTALRFYKGPTNSGTHVGRLWEVDGTLLGSAVFVGETATGWQEQTFATPVAIDSNTTYIASYFAPQGGYSVDTGYFALSGVTNVPLRALVDGEDGGNGVYRYGEGAFPDLSFNSANYWVDIVFEDVLSPDTNAPVVFSVDPGVGQTNVGLNTSVTATFDEPVDAASVTTNTFTLQDATNGFVAATVGAGSAAEIVVLSPVAPLADSATYTATLKSGGGGITDLAGNPLASDFSWSFTTTGPDTNAPTVVSVSPGPGVDSVAVATRVTASFSEVMNGATIDTNTFTLKDASNQLVTASVAYDVATGRATLTPSELLLAETAYTATIAGGVGGVEDVAGNTLATNYTWVFTTMADNPYGDGPGGPILVLTDGTNSFNAYYAEILLTEGLNSFSLQDVSSVSNAAALAGFDIVLVGDLELTGAQVGILSNWVSGGGDLIAMRPDKKLAGLLGLVDAATTLSEGYLSVNTTVSPGAGIVDETMQFHGVADLYTVSDAVTVGTLFSDATTSTVWPAVTIRSVGTNGGQVAAFTYDLARSIVYTRQGNPQWAGQERDGQSPLRSDDLFYGNASFDPQPDWVDLDKAAIPQADEQQRLLANMILEMNMDQRPLPRFWYFPDAHKAVVVMTGDDHSVNGTEARFDDYIAASPTNGSLENWELVRGSSYIYPDTPLSNSVAAAFEAQGFEIAPHITSGCLDYDRESLESFFATQLGEYQTAYPSLSPPETLRIHCVAWSGYTLLPEVALQYGIRLDTSYYYWPPGWVAGRIGMFTGSAMPMRFATTNGNVVDVFQATTQMTDESGQIYPLTVDTLLDRALGEEGYYGAYVANLHTDVNPLPESDAVVASCQARGVPVITSLQLLRWVDARNSSATTNITWSSNTLSFSVVADSEARGLQSMVPVDTGFQVQEVRSNDVSVSFSTETIKGVSYAFIPAGTADYEVDFAFDDVGPVVVSVSPTNGATEVSASTTVSVVFDEAMDAGTITSNTIVLVDSATNTLAASVSYDNGSFTATLTPDSALSLLETYTATAVSGASGVKDVAGNELTNDFAWTFTTIERVNVWADTDTPAILSAADTNSIELGVKIRSEIPGYITGVRYYRGTNNPGPHVGNLWTGGGSSLASVTFSSETASGWQEQLFATPVAIMSNTTYVVSYHAPTGGYSATANYFNGQGATNYPLRALADGEDGSNGVFTYGPPASFPTNTFNAANYWVDVVFQESLGPDTNAPVVVSVSPTDGAGEVSTNTTVSVEFSEGMDAGTITSNTIVLVDSATNTVAAAVAYNAGTFTATLTPSSALSAGEGYSAAVVSGALGVKDVAGNELATDFVWSFTTEAPDLTAPVVVSVSPTNGAGGVSPNATLSVVFDEAMDAGTITSNTIVLVDGGSSAVAASVSYDNGSFTATLTPASPLSLLETYTATVVSGASGVKDVAGNELASDEVWSFTTTDVLTYSLWDNATTPLNPEDSDPSAVELGVKFESELDGYITGIRFYKGPNNIGVHAGNLWSLGGSNLGSLTFSNETASGWQEQLFGSPVLIASNTTYVASYFAPQGRGAFDLGYFTNGAYVNAPLRALADGEQGGNGVFDLSGSSAFPTNGGGNNYWVDVVFQESVGPDTNAPVVVSVSPTDGASEVSTNTTVSVEFNEAMDAGTIASNTIVLVDSATNTVAAAVAYNAGTFTATLTPSSALSAGEGYSATVVSGASGVKDVAGNELATDFVWTFTTEAPDLTAPVVVSVSPTNGAGGVSLNTTLSVVFDEAMDAGTITSNTIVLVDGGSSAVAASVSYDNGSFTATLIPASPLSLLETYTATVVSGASGVKDVAGNELASDFVWNFTTIDVLTYSLWDNSATPAVLSESDFLAVELGMKFQSAIDGFITGIRFYKGPANTNTHSGRLWTTSGGVPLASVTFSNETASGWQEQLFGSPVAIDSNTTYVVSYHAPNGGYSKDLNGFLTEISNPPLRALANGEEGGNGVFKYGAAGTFPTNSGNAANYWVDVVWQDSLGPDTNAPVVVSVSPTNGAGGVSPNATLSVVFDEAMDAGTITSNTIVLVDGGSSAVAASVSYDNGSFTATLTPASPLSLLETYTATVVSGASGVKDVAGNELASDEVWSFTTTGIQTYSLWDNATTPLNPEDSDPSAVELGVKFESELDGYITGIRFYKGPNNIGVHAGNLWSLGGSNLASLTFSNETVSGWQEQLFEDPVAISSNTTYVASYFAPQGRGAFDLGYFTNGAYVNAPLRALADGEQGGNGVFDLSGSSAFPTNGSGNNYWVDVVFAQSLSNTPPVFDGVPLDVELVELTLLSVTNGAGDVDVPVQALSYTLSVGPTNAAIDTNGVISWTPNEQQGPSTNTFTTVVSDGQVSATNSFVVTVTETNAVPVFDGVPLDVELVELTLLSVTNGAGDVDVPVQALSYTLSVGPTNAAIDTNGVISWTPNEQQGPSTNTFTTVVSDGQVSATNSFVVTVTETNAVPVFDGVPVDVELVELTLLSVTNGAGDVDVPVQALSYTLSVGPTNAVIDTNGVISWTPNEQQGPSTNTFTTVVSDGQVSATNSFVVTVTETNAVPVFDGVPLDVELVELTLLSVTNGAGDVDVPVQALSYTLSVGPTNAVVDTNGVISWTPNEQQGPSTNTFTTVVSDGQVSATNSFVVTVTETNAVPVFDGVPVDVELVELTLLSVTNGAGDVDVPVQALSYTLSVGPTNAVVDTNGVISWTPNEQQGPSTNTFTTVVSDGQVSATNSFVVTVTETNAVPVFDGVPLDVELVELTLLSVTNGAGDVDVPVQALSYTLSVGPTNAVVDTNGVISWTPNEQQGPSTNTFTTVVSDGQVSATNSFVVTVTETNAVPVFDGVPLDVELVELTLLSVTNGAGDVDVPVQALSYTLSVGPTNAVVDTNGVISWTPNEQQGPSTNTFTTVVSDGQVSATNSFVVTVTETNAVPVFDGVPLDVELVELTLLSVTNGAGDVDVPVQALSYTLSVGPTNAAIDTNGVISWTPNEQQGPSTNTFTTVVSDGQVSATNSFVVTVTETNAVPVFDGVPVDVELVELTLLSVTNGAGDVDVPVQALSYTLSVGPTNAAIDTNGVISWTPNEQQGPSTNTFTTVVSDGQVSATNSFVVTVTETNAVPVFDGVPVDVELVELTLLSVTNGAGDVDVPVQALSYTLSVGPTNAVVDTNGVISWTPNEQQGPSTNTFTTVVSDGQVSATNSFVVTVTETNAVPVFDGVPLDVELVELTLLSVTNGAGDVDVPVQALSYTLSVGPTNAVVDTNGVISWTPNEQQGPSTNTFTTVVSDGQVSATNSFVVTVTETNAVPVFDGVPLDVELVELTLLSVTNGAGDVDVPVQALSYTLSVGPTNAVVDTNGVISWTPNEQQGPSTNTFTTVVSDGQVSATNSFVVTVTETNAVPVFDGVPLDVELVELTLLSVTNGAGDVDVPVQALSYTLSVGPTNAAIDTNGVISWTPNEQQGPSTNTFTTVVSDGQVSATNSFVVTVTETNAVPVFDGVPLDVELVELTLLSVTNGAGDVDVPVQALSYTLSVGPTNAVVDTNGVISWTPNEQQGPSTNTFTTVVSDGQVSATNSFVVTVTETNAVPVFDGVPVDVELVELTLLSVTNGAGDVDVPVQALSYTLSVGPTNAAIDTNGVISWTPNEQQGPSTNTFTTVVSDGQVSATNSFVVTVTETNAVPVFDGVPLDVELVELTLLSVTNGAGDVDVPVQALSYTLSVGPTNAVVDTNGVISWTPNEQQGPSTNTFTTVVSDGQVSATNSFVVTVTETNAVPVFDGVPLDVELVELTLLSVTNGAGDVDVPVQALSYTLSVGPTNAAIDTNGVISWTPNEQQGPSTNTFTTVVSDGQVSATNSFVVTVTETNAVPVFDGVPLDVELVELTLLSVTNGAGDVDVPVQALSYTLSVGPTNAVVDTNGVISWTPNEQQGPSTNTFTTVVSDGQVSATNSFVVTVTETNAVPVFDGVPLDVELVELTLLSVTNGAGDVDVPVQALSYTLSVGPTNAVVDTNGVISWTPNEQQGPSTNTFTTVVSDGQVSATNSFVVTVTETNAVPVFDGVPLDVELVELTLLSVTNGAGDVDVPVQALSYTLSVGPTNAVVDTNGVISWTPNEQQGPSTNTFTTVVSDGQVSATNSFVVTVTETNAVPVFDGVPVDVELVELTLLSVTNGAGDVDVPVQALSYTLSVGPTNAVVDTNGVISWTPNEQQGPSTNTFTTVVSDGQVSATNSFVVTVTETNAVPVFDGVPVDVELVELTLLSVTNGAGDVDVPVQALSYTLSVGPTNAAIDTNGVISWTPNEQQGPSTNTFTTVVSDGQASATNSFVVTVTETNAVPVFDGVPVDVELVELTLLSVTNGAGDVDVPVQALSYTLSVGPTNAAIDTNGVISWTPNEQQGPSTNTFTTVVSDGQASATNSFVVTVTETNAVPVFDGVPLDVELVELTLLSVTNGAGDVDVPVQALSYTLSVGPTNAVVDTNGVISWTPNEQQGPSTNTFTTVVSDGQVSATNSFVVTVTETNAVPVFDGVPLDVELVELTLLSVTNGAGDVDVPVQALSYTLSVGPTNAVVDTNGVISWTPNEQQGPSTNTFTTVVSDGQVSATNSFVVTVTETNAVPVFDGVPLDVELVELTLLSVTNGAGDVDVPVQALSYTLSVGPTNAVVDTNGVISWTPNEQQGPSTNTFTTVVSDNGGLSATNSFVVTVTETNAVPVFDGVPLDVELVELTLLSVTNGAGDVDVPVQALSYTLSVGPTNAAIDTNGVISWTPNEQQGPSTNTFTTVVSDGQVSATNSFVVTVSEVNTAPVANADSYTITNASITVVAPGVLGNDGDVDVPSNTLTAELVSNPTKGSLVLSSNGGFTYTPDPKFNGVDSFTYRVGDGMTSSAPSSVTLVVSNHLFVITSIQVNGGVATVTWKSEAGVDYRLLYKDDLGAPEWSVVPGDLSATGLSSSKQDILGSSPQRFYRVQVVTNSGPTLPVQSNRVVDELTMLVVTNAGSDVDLPVELLTYALLQAPTNALIDTNGVISWTPSESQGPSTNTFTTVVSDNGGLSATNSFVVTVTETNAVPVFDGVPLDVELVELTLLSVTNGAGDVDVPVQALSYTLSVGPTNAAIDTNGVISWTPGENQGPSTNTFTTVVSDGQVSATNSFVVTVSEVNTAPVANADSYTITNASITVVAPGVLGNDGDVDVPSNTLTAELVSNPTKGSLVLSSNGGFTYTPDPKFNGVDSFTYRVGDGMTSSAPSSVTLVVSNHLFVITSIQVNGGVATVTWKSEAGVDYRLLYKDDLGAPEWSVVPGDLSATGLSSSKQDILGSSPQRFYRVQVVTNSGPTLPVQSNRVVDELTMLVVTNAGSDVDLPVELLTYALLQAPTNALIDTNGVISWTPSESQGPSTNTFTTVVSDNGGLSATNSFVVTVSEVNTVPVANADNYTITNASITVVAPGVLGNDGDVDMPSNTLTAELVSDVTKGSLVLSSDGGFTYTPDPTFNGVDSFTYRVDDGMTSSAPSSVTLVVSNHLFVITSIQVNGGVATVTWKSEAGVDYRLLYKDDLTAPEWSVVPGDLSATGLSSSRQDILGSSPQRFYRVQVVTNNAPTLPVQSNRVVDELTMLVVTNAGSDVDLPVELLTYALLQAPTNALIDTNGVISWTPGESQGPSTNTFITVLTDNGGLSASNSFQVVVNEVNEAPVLASTPIDVEITELSALSVTNSASDVDVPAQILTYTLLAGPGNAGIDTNGVISWTPTETQGPGTNTFVTRVDDGVVSVSNSFVVTVSEVNEAPTFDSVPPNMQIGELTLLSVTNSASDSDVPAQALTYALITGPPTAAIDSNGVISWTPLGNQGPSSNTFTTTVTDGLAEATNSFVVAVVDTVVVPPTVEATSTGSAMGTNLVTVNHNTGSNANRLMLVGISLEDDASDGCQVSSVTYAGAPLSRVIQAATLLEAEAEIWMLVNPPAGLGTVSVNLTSVESEDSVVVGVTTFFGVDTSAPLGTPGSASGIAVSGTASVAVVSAESDLVYGVLAMDNGGTVTPDGGQTEHWNLRTESGANGITGSGCTRLGAPSVTLSWSVAVWFDSYAACAVPVRPASPNTFITPVVSDDNYVLGQLTDLSIPSPGVLANDFDSDGDALSVVLVDPPTQGAVVLSASGGFNYTLTNHFTGVDTFTYRANDGQATSGVATVSIAVTNEFRITSIAITNGVALVQWTSIPGFVYQLQYKDGLSSTNWMSVSPGVLATGSTTSEMSPTENAVNRFYRVQLLTSVPAPRITSINVSEGVATVKWTAVAGQDYQLEYKDSLSDTEWTPLPAVITATGPLAVGTNVVGAATQRFYRVVPTS